MVPAASYLFFDVGGFNKLLTLSHLFSGPMGEWAALDRASAGVRSFRYSLREGLVSRSDLLIYFILFIWRIGGAVTGLYSNNIYLTR